ncbi:hypothetical protein L1987_24118 [Smallanthus sonchifolius]|uniref:Uncharacterized protein n=1 Tax=Smallanthus sonchifolius TaxID=185202 RepID=A0ACB9IK51_9ASTR|nr:hypothetical protein L1987_24118 [Smallanthus sonchifolius]
MRDRNPETPRRGTRAMARKTTWLGKRVKFEDCRVVFPSSLRESGEPSRRVEAPADYLEEYQLWKARQEEERQELSDRIATVWGHVTEHNYSILGIIESTDLLEQDRMADKDQLMVAREEAQEARDQNRKWGTIVTLMVFVSLILHYLT